MDPSKLYTLPKSLIIIAPKDKQKNNTILIP